ncbi:MAG: exodeoxyribonuclease III [Burkholderiaceae bacterium]|nr:MAG: exodeoxyribonuclease III [Burkholderiaceae bacterium]
MQLATWNVNSLKVRLPQVLQWLQSNPVDVLCLQELKLTDDKFPITTLEAAGYRSFFAGQKTYNGVAILVREGNAIDTASLVANNPLFADEQKRLLALTVNGVRVICGYFPNGQAVGSEKYQYKLAWLDALHNWIALEMQQHAQLALLGDYNIAPEDRDVHDPAAWEGMVHVSPPERERFFKLAQLGLVDVFRQFEQPEKSYSWWDYRMMGFRRNHGLRIDLILLTPPLAQRCTACTVDKTPRAWEQPSDHAPVVATLNLL